MIRSLAWVGGWSLFWLGHAGSKVLNAFPDWDWLETPAYWLYCGIYRWPMLKSCDLSDRFGLGIWTWAKDA